MHFKKAASLKHQVFKWFDIIMMINNKKVSCYPIFQGVLNLTKFKKKTMFFNQLKLTP